MIIKISVEEALNLENSLIIDARSPKEFNEDHIIGAINVPLLNDQERHEIGLIYKQKSRDKAIERGIELFPSKIPSIFNAVKDHRNKKIIVYCARGGMRSKIIASLISSIGFNVFQMNGGYKSFRNYLLKELNNFKIKPKLIVLHGLTCTGKTKLLQKFLNSLDLESLAQHRGSLYGGIGLIQNSQKKFENLLFQKLNELRNEKYIIIEGESRRIGNLIIPKFLFKEMNNGTNILITRNIEKRVEEAIKEYFDSKEKIKKIKEITTGLWKIIGKEKKEKVIKLIEEKKHSPAAKILLEEYYDPLYKHSLKKIKFIYEINNDNVNDATIKLKRLFLDTKKTTNYNKQN